MTPDRPSAAGGGEASRDWATVLDELEGEVLAARSTLRSDRRLDSAASTSPSSSSRTVAQSRDASPPADEGRPGVMRGRR